VDIEHAHIGRRVREVRNWRQMKLSATAGLAGMSPAYLSMIERGQRPVTKRSVLEAIARALRVSPVELTGQPQAPSDEGTAETHTAMATLADLLGGWWVGEVPDTRGRPLAELRDRLAAFHAARNSGTKAAGDYATQVGTLAPLIRDLLAAAADPDSRRAALPPLLTAYHVAGSISARLRIPGMPSLAADRMRQVADELDDPEWMAVADWGRAHFLSGTNRPRQYEMAVAVAEDPAAGRSETRGMAHLTAALAAAAQDQPDVAQTHLDAAGEFADQIDQEVSPWPAGIMQFGRTNVGIFAVSIGVELGDGPRVAEPAAKVRPETTSLGRQASFWVDFGRGMLAERKTRDRGLQALVHAEQLAPHQVRTNVFARESVSNILASAQRDAGGRELRGLAWRMGVAPTG
jgi:transcriptional regulator with XRE-family HTH domain